MSHNITRIIKSWLMALATLAAHAAFAANAIERVEFSQLPDQTLVKVTLKGGLAAVPSSFSVAAPPRVAFDFPETENATGNNAIAANVGVLNSVNIVQAGERTRLVLNLASPNHYETKLDGNTLYIALSNGPVAVAPAMPAAERSPTSQPTTEQNRVALNNLDFQANSAELATIRIDLSDPSAVLDAHKQGNTGLLLTFADTDLPARLEKRLDVRDFGSPVDSITTKRYGKGVQVSFANRGDWTYSVRQIDATVIVEVRKIVDDPSNLAGAKELQGKVISFNFTQPVPVSQMIGIFQDITGLNFVVIPGISGEIQSLKMENTPVNVAIDVISRMYGLGFRRYGDIVMVGTAASLAAYDQEERKRAADLVKSEPIQQETFNIRYRTASEIGQCLVTPQQCSGGAASTQTGQAASGQAGYTPTTSGAAPAAGSTQQRQSSSIISADGSISWDDATSVIIVEETKTRLDKIRERIAALDRPIKQVMIEARIVQVDANFTRELGIALSGKTDYQIGGTKSNFTFGHNSSVGTSGATNIGFSLFNSSQSKLITLALNASEADTKVKSIASPKVLTKDSVAASLNYTKTFTPPTTYLANGQPYQPPASHGTIGLTVTPKIMKDSKVQMQLTVNGDSNDDPTIQQTRTVTSTVVVENGGTVVLGGLYIQADSVNEDRVPFFGDLPYVGFLFKNKATKTSKSELLVFITPRIVTDDLTLQ